MIVEYNIENVDIAVEISGLEANTDYTMYLVAEGNNNEKLMYDT